MKTASLRVAPFVVRFSAFCSIALLGCFIAGCGGGSSGGGGGKNPPPADFALSLSSSSVTIAAGQSASVTATVTGSNGFNSAVTLSITGLPSGVTVSPASLQLSPSSPLKITFSAAASVVNSTATANVTGTSASLSHTAQLSVTLQASTIHPSLSRTRYLRTDAATEYFGALNASWIVYDSPTQRFFVSDPSGNEITVLDAVNRVKIASIPVPGAYGIDETPDHTLIYAGTQVGDLYAIDPVGMKVTHRYLSSQIGPSGYAVYSARVLANGKLALLGGQGGIPNIDGFSGFAVWNPVDNSIVTYGNAIFGGEKTSCVENIGAFTLTGDRTLIVEASIDSDATLCTVDPSTGAVNQTTAATEFLFSIVPTPDGKSLLLPSSAAGGSVEVLNAKTLTQTALFSIAADASSAASMIVSPDSKTVYMSSGSEIYAYDIASGQFKGWTPNLVVEPTSGGFEVGSATGPELQAFDGTGMLAGPMEEGVGFIDTTALQTGPIGTQFTNAYLTPATGPVGGGTQTQWSGAETSSLAAVYFGGVKATSFSQSSNGLFNAATPPGSPGPVDVSSVMADGGVQIVPEGFSYGPTILEATPDSATAEGGETGIVYGYGFGSTSDSTIPTALQVTVGGKTAAVTAYAANAYGSGSPPFLLQAFAYTIPAGSADSSADISVTSSSGTAKLSGGMHYLPKLQQFPLNGAVLAQGIYDAKRDLYYFTDTAKVQVFSLSQGEWLSPIAVPAAPASTTHRLWGLSLSPDRSELAVSDLNAGTIYLIDPDMTSSVKSFTVPGTGIGGLITDPAGLAISDSGVIYFTAVNLGGTGASGYYKLDTGSGQFTNLNITGPGLGGGDAQLRAAISSDSTRVFFNNDGQPFSIDTASGTVFYASIDPGCCYGDYDLSLSNNQTQFEATSYLYDTNLDAESYLVLNDREILNISYVYGTKLNSDGSLLFQPSTNGIDVFDGRLGTLRTRIALPVALAQNFDALVSDGKDNVLIAITGATGNGIAVVNLSSLSEPPPLTYQDQNAFVSGRASGRNDLATAQTRRQQAPVRASMKARVPRTLVPRALNPISPQAR